MGRLVVELSMLAVLALPAVLMRRSAATWLIGIGQVAALICVRLLIAHTIHGDAPVAAFSLFSFIGIALDELTRFSAIWLLSSHRSLNRKSAVLFCCAIFAAWIGPWLAATGVAGPNIPTETLLWNGTSALSQALLQTLLSAMACFLIIQFGFDQLRAWLIALACVLALNVSNLVFAGLMPSSWWWALARPLALTVTTAFVFYAFRKRPAVP